jgi:hypothetical protein
VTLAIFFPTVGFLAVASSTTIDCLHGLRSILLPIKTIGATAEGRALTSSPKALTVIFAALAFSATALMSYCLGFSFLGIQGIYPCFIVE